MLQAWSCFDRGTQAETTNNEHTATVHCSGGRQLWLWKCGRKPTGYALIWTSQIPTVTHFLLEGPPDKHSPTPSWTHNFSQLCESGERRKGEKSQKAYWHIYTCTAPHSVFPPWKCKTLSSPSNSWASCFRKEARYLCLSQRLDQGCPRNRPDIFFPLISNRLVPPNYTL